MTDAVPRAGLVWLLLAGHEGEGGGARLPLPRPRSPEHPRQPDHPLDNIGRGIAGHVAATGETVVVPSVDTDERKITINDRPRRDQIDTDINEQLIVELYSK